MDKLDKENPTSKILRYSVPVLLKIGHFCEANKTPFDLARLSFAVFHGNNILLEPFEQSIHLARPPLNFRLLTLALSTAGFVKPPGAYARNFAMPLQDISINRNRGWSLGTASSAEDYIVFSGSGRGPLKPRRQPVNAPGSPDGRIQADKEFVRFLETHSSSTRQCVTAGDRIVPTEPPSAPPQFRLIADDSNHRGTAPAARNIEDGPVWRDKRLENSCLNIHNELRNGTRKPFNPNANFHLSQEHRLLTEPFPNSYDGQTGREDIQKAATEKDQADLTRNTGSECYVRRPAPQSLGIGQNTAHSATRALDKHLTTSTTSQTTATLLRQVHLPIHGATSTGCASTNPQYPPKMQSSQQQIVNASQYLPNTMAFALDGVSSAMTPDLGYNAQGVSQQPLTAGFGACHGLDFRANQAVLYPDLFPMASQGFQVPPFLGLPMYANQIGLVPPASYAPDPFNTSAPLLSGLAMQPITNMSMPLAAPNTLNTSASEAPTQWRLQQELALAETSFENSTEQERMLDQHLAMHMDKMELQTRRAWTGRRMEIVEARAAAKDRMNQVQQALNAEIDRTANVQPDCPSLTSLWLETQNRPANRLNVQAPSWIPKAGTDSNKAVRIQHPSALTTTAATITSQRVSPTQVNLDESKLTPLKHTTTASEDHSAAKQTALVFSPEKLQVDEWGARLGAAPPELEREQSEQSQLLESMASEASRASASPRGFIGNVSEPNGSWEANDGCPRPQVEADHEQYLDAIRKDLSTTSVLTLSSGQVVKVEGQNYKQPKSKYTSTDFERDYWLRKPDPDQRLRASDSRPFERSFESIMCTPSPRKTKQTQEWVNRVVDVQKPACSGRAPWITDGMNLLSTKGYPSISLQDTFATSKSRGTNGAASHLRGQRG